MSIRTLSDTSRRKREEVYNEGYFIDSADDLTAGVDSTDETIHLLGKVSPLAGVSVDNGNVSVTILRENAAAQAMPQVITDGDPLVSDVAIKAFNWDQVIATQLWTNIENAARTYYLGGIFYPAWLPSIAGPAGAPNDRARRTFAGKSGIPKEITGIGMSIQARLVMSGNHHIIPGDSQSGNSIFVNSGSGLQAQPGKTNVYALGILAINSGSTTSWTREFLSYDDVTAAMLLPTGRVHFPAIAAAVSIVPTHAMVYFVYSGTGIYPASGFVPSRLSRTGTTYP